MIGKRMAGSASPDCLSPIRLATTSAVRHARAWSGRAIRSVRAEATVRRVNAPALWGMLLRVGGVGVRRSVHQNFAALVFFAVKAKGCRRDRRAEVRLGRSLALPAFHSKGSMGLFKPDTSPADGRGCRRASLTSFGWPWAIRAV